MCNKSCCAGEIVPLQVVLLQVVPLKGCVMTGVTRHGGDFATIKNVSNYAACNELCSERDDCLDWTYIEGACYVKTENTFCVRNKNVVGGYKDCDSATRTGQLLIRFLSSLIQ